VLWVEAIEAARRAEGLLAGSDAGPERKDRVREALDVLVRERKAFEAAEKDRRIVERRAAVLNDFGVHGDERKANADYAAAFRAYGVDVDSLPPSAAGRLLADSPVAPELASALDQWAILRRSRVLRDPAGAARLVTVARASDPDPWRDRLRDTVGRMQGGPARRLEVLERLAATADVEHLPRHERHPAGDLPRDLRPARDGDRPAAARAGLASRHAAGTPAANVRASIAFASRILVAKGVPSEMPDRLQRSGSSVHSSGRYSARSRNAVPWRPA
jgi:hypothetical protein